MNLETSLVYFIDEGILAGKSPKTLKGYQYSLNSLLQYIKINFLPQEVTSCTHETLSQFIIQGLQIKKWSKYTHWTMYKNLHAYFNWCVKKGYIPINPFDQMPKPKMPLQPPKALTEADAILLLRLVANDKTVFRFAKHRNKAMVACFLFTGLRKSELINLRTEDVDLQNNIIFVENGKGGKKREVPIEQSALRPVLQEYLEFRQYVGKRSEWFFIGARHGMVAGDKLTESAINRVFHDLTEKLGKRVYAHKLRHTFATLMLDKGADLYTLQQLMGHARITTTTIYLSSTHKKKAEAIEKLKLGEL